MLYLNQLDYPDVPYIHDKKNGGAPADKCNAAAAACGPCCLCMVVDHLTRGHMELTDCLKLSDEVGANMDRGTSLKILGPVMAEKFGLSFDMTDDLEKVIEHLSRGGLVIANAGGDRDGYTGVFTHGGHYIEILSYADGEFCIFDPSYKEGKFEEEGRQGKVRTDKAPYLYCTGKVLAEDCSNRTPAYYLFARQR